jgi:hypothetical protein
LAPLDVSVFSTIGATPVPSHERTWPPLIAVDAEHHLIVAHEVINQGYDRHQLAPMAFKAQQATGCEQITALADRGYFTQPRSA